MPFAFEHSDANVEDGLRRIAGEQIDKALEEASNPHADFDETVHGLRRRCKNLRGLLRMVKPRLTVFEDEDAAVSGIATRLSQARDAAVMLMTLDKLVLAKGGGPPVIDAADHKQLHDLLAERERGMAQHMDQAGLFAEFSEAMLAMRGRVEGWALERKKFGGIAEGIEATYRRLRERMADAAADEAPLLMHAWRKQAKYHRHHVMLLRRHAPDEMNGRSKLLGELGDLLGDHHDLAVLIEVLNGRAVGAPAALAKLTSLASERQKGLSDKAFALGRQVAAEKPRALTERLRQYWMLEAA
ncbi:CHAD domain-containing protein [uncultured Devosia sp.]|uniref:CHAD domain-containing protein n=1 Tax=uncultured Devosia sp. TaxID=211434 RepID=UPI0035CC4FD3